VVTRCRYGMVSGCYSESPCSDGIFRDRGLSLRLWPHNMFTTMRGQINCVRTFVRIFVFLINELDRPYRWRRDHTDKHKRKDFDMTRNVIALATAAALTLGAAAPSFAMENEHNMLVGAVYNQLSQLGIDTNGIGDLTLSQIAELKTVLSGDSMSESQKKTAAMKVIDR